MVNDARLPPVVKYERNSTGGESEPSAFVADLGAAVSGGVGRGERDGAGILRVPRRGVRCGLEMIFGADAPAYDARIGVIRKALAQKFYREYSRGSHDAGSLRFGQKAG